MIEIGDIVYIKYYKMPERTLLPDLKGIGVVIAKRRYPRNGCQQIFWLHPPSKYHKNMNWFDDLDNEFNSLSDLHKKKA